MLLTTPANVATGRAYSICANSVPAGPSKLLTLREWPGGSR